MADLTKLYELRDRLLAAKETVTGYEQQLAQAHAKISEAAGNIDEWLAKVQAWIAVLENLPKP